MSTIEPQSSSPAPIFEPTEPCRSSHDRDTITEAPGLLVVPAALEQAVAHGHPPTYDAATLETPASASTIAPDSQLYAPQEDVEGQREPTPTTDVVLDAETQAWTTPDPDLQRYMIDHDRTVLPIAPRPHEYPPPPSLFDSAASDVASLPAYGSNNPPVYTHKPTDKDLKEPKTLSRFFFRFGFVFPAFWIFGALMLITPLRSPSPFNRETGRATLLGDPELAAWCDENLRTLQDREAFLAHMHLVEMKWAMRCVLALGIFVAIAVSVGVTSFAVFKGSK